MSPLGQPDEDRLFPEENTCSADDLQEAVRGFLLGDLTLAQLEGVSADDLYGFADIGYDYMVEGQVDVARRIFEGLVAYNPMDPYFHALLGSAYQKLGRASEAIPHYESAVELHPTEVSWWTNLGEAYISRGTELRREKKTNELEVILRKARLALDRAIALDRTGRSGSALRAKVLRGIVGR